MCLFAGKLELCSSVRFLDKHHSQVTCMNVTKHCSTGSAIFPPSDRFGYKISNLNPNSWAKSGVYVSDVVGPATCLITLYKCEKAWFPQGELRIVVCALCVVGLTGFPACSSLQRFVFSNFLVRDWTSQEQKCFTETFRSFWWKQATHRWDNITSCSKWTTTNPCKQFYFIYLYFLRSHGRLCLSTDPCKHHGTGCISRTDPRRSRSDSLKIILVLLHEATCHHIAVCKRKSIHKENSTTSEVMRIYCND